MTQDLHLVFGGELADPQTADFDKPDDIDVVGIFPDYQSAYDAWKSSAQRTVDNAHMRYFISRIAPLTDAETPGS